MALLAKFATVLAVAALATAGGASAANYCSSYASSTECTGRDPNAGCTWISVTASGSASSSNGGVVANVTGGTCIYPQCSSANNNASKCATFSPACEFIDQQATCRSINPCAVYAVNATACRAATHCAWMNVSSSSSTGGGGSNSPSNAANGTCAIQCALLTANTCGYFGGLCVMNRTSGACVANVTASSVTPTTTTTKAPSTTSAAATTTAKPTERPANATTTTTAAPATTTVAGCAAYTTSEACARNKECAWTNATLTSNGGCKASNSSSYTTTTTAPATKPTEKPTDAPIQTTSFAPTSATGCAALSTREACAANRECTWVTDNSAGSTVGACRIATATTAAYSTTPDPSTPATKPTEKPTDAPLQTTTVAPASGCASLNTSEACARNKECVWSSDSAAGGFCTHVATSSATAAPTGRPTDAPIQTTSSAAPAADCAALSTREACAANKECTWVTDNSAGSTVGACRIVTTPAAYSTTAPATKPTDAPLQTTTVAPTTGCASLNTSEACARNKECVWSSDSAVGGFCRHVATTSAPSESSRTTSAPPAPSTTATTTPAAPIPTRVPPTCLPTTLPAVFFNYTTNSVGGSAVAVGNSTLIAARSEYANSRWAYLVAGVRSPYYACNTDISSLVRYAWTAAKVNAEGTGGDAVTLPRTVDTSSAMLSIPPYTFLDASAFYLFTVYASYTAPSGFAVSQKAALLARFAAPTSVMSLPGGNITVGATSSFALTATVRVPCTSAADAAANCAATSTSSSIAGLKNYECVAESTEQNPSPCTKDAATRLSWYCTVVTAAMSSSSNSNNESSCAGIAALLAEGRTTYRSLSLPVGTYWITAALLPSIARGASGVRQIVVTAAAEVIPLTLTCSKGRFITEQIQCVAIAASGLYTGTYVWRVDGVEQPQTIASNGRSMVMHFAPKVTGPTVVTVTVADPAIKGSASTASFTVPAAYNSTFVCTRDFAANTSSSSASSSSSSSVAIGLSTSIAVRCTVGLGADVAAELTYGYRITGTAASSSVTALSTVAQPVRSTNRTASTVFSFTAPPANGTLSIVVQLSIDGAVVMTAYPSTVSVYYAVTSADLAALRQRAEDGKATGDAGRAVEAASALATAMRTSDDDDEKKASAASLIDVIGDALNRTRSSSSGSTSSSASSAVSDTMATMAADAIAGAVLSTAATRNNNDDKNGGATTTVAPAANGGGSSSSSASVTSTLDEETRKKAAAALAEVARQAAEKGDDATRNAILRAAAALGDGSASGAIARDVALGMAAAAPADGQTRQSGSDDVKVGVTSFIASDTSARSVADGNQNGARLPANSTALGDFVDPTQKGSLVASTTPAPAANSTAAAAAADKPANAGRQFISGITSFDVYVDGVKVDVKNLPANASVTIQLYVGLGNGAGSASAPPREILYWDEVAKQWRAEGITMASRCDNSSLDATHICGTTSHFTSFAVFVSASAGPSGDDSGSSDDDGAPVGLILGCVVGGVLVLAIAGFVAVKLTRRGGARSGKSAASAEEGYSIEGGQAVPLHELDENGLVMMGGGGRGSNHV